MAARVAGFSGLSLEEIEGSNRLLTKLVEGPWDEDFVVVEPGETVSYEQFLSR